MMDNTSSSSLSFFHHCFDSTAGTVICYAFIITNIFLFLPLSLLVLYLGHQRWRQKCSFTTTSHSDIFTYSWAALELIYLLGFTFYFCGKHFGLTKLITMGYYTTSIFYPGQMYFHVLTCMEHYLAVVYPVFYMRLRQSGGVRIRNIYIVCALLLCCGWIIVEALYFPDVPYIPLFCWLVLFLVVVSFCSVSVLCVLIRPGPGEMGGKREQNDQSKQRAFHTITAITGVLWLFFLGLLVCIALDKSNVLSYNDGCLVLMSSNWFSLPSSLVLPLLFLHRAQKVLCCQ